MHWEPVYVIILAGIAGISVNAWISSWKGKGK